VRSLVGWGAAVCGHNDDKARAVCGVALLRLSLHGGKEERESERVS
jgi:hypothetical protein